MKKAMLSLFALGLVVCGPGDILPGFPSGLGLKTAEAAASKHRITWDVAIDCRTWRFNSGTSFQDFGRGDGFIANGKIFPARTLPSGVQSNDPNDPGSIGTWVERGTMAATLVEIVAGTRPAFFGTWYHLLDDGPGLVADGPHPDTGPMAVIGGMGAFSGASGELSAEIIGTNITGCPNLRLTVNLKRKVRRSE
jgi:hypothetical protein